jgi:hypothetical protein
MIDTTNGFYFFKGFCQPDPDGVCFRLSAIFTPYTTAGMDQWTETMIGSISAVVGFIVILSIISTCYLWRRQRAMPEIERQEGVERLATYGA